jgi:hypothetical protein
MSEPEEIQFCQARSNVLWGGGVQFSEFGQVEVADYSNVKYFEPSDSEEEEQDGKFKTAYPQGGGLR